MWYKLTCINCNVRFLTPYRPVLDSCDDGECVKASRRQIVDHFALWVNRFFLVSAINTIEIRISNRFVPAQMDRCFCHLDYSKVFDFVRDWK